MNGQHMQREIYEIPEAIERLAASPPALLVERALLVAHGSSLNACLMAATTMRGLGAQIRCCLPQNARRFPGERRVAVTQSGQTRDIIEAASDEPDSIVVTNGAAPEGMEQVLVHAGAEQAVCATKTVVNTIMALELMANEHVRVSMIEHWARLAKRIEMSIPELHRQAREHAEQVARARAVWVVGEHERHAVAQEIALKLQESSARLAIALPAVGGLHGPVVAIDSDDVVIMLTSAVPHSVIDRYRAACSTIEIDTASSYVIDLVWGQLLALEVARVLECDPDAPDGLAKVTNH